MVVRPERPEDYPNIAAVIRDAFGQEDEARLVERLRNDADYDPDLALVAIDGDELVGHVCFSGVQILRDDERTNALALAPLAVRTDMQRRNIGSTLVRRGLEACKRKGHGVIIVLGEPAFYGRFGFFPASAAGIHPPFAAPDVAFQVLEFRPGALQNVRGVVRYSSAFDQL